MQILYEGSDEHGAHAGLGMFPGLVSRFTRAPRVPHMGWNELEIVAIIRSCAAFPPARTPTSCIAIAPASTR
jgi:imidazoleglycerol phosphate synthase glutamine amidotransferase subunit HisH